MEDKRQLVLNAALKLFVEQGFHATPTKQIAEVAGVANGTIFHYFKTKEELINTLYLETKAFFEQKITEEFDGQMEIKKRFFIVWKKTIAWSDSFPYHFKFIQQFSNSPFLSSLTREQIQRHIQFFLDQFSEGIALGFLKPLPVDLLFQMSSYHVYGTIYYLYEHPELIKDSNLMEKLFESYWGSISK